MIYEIFNAVNGSTQGYRFGEEAARKLIERVPNAMWEEKSGEIIVLDYLPAMQGFYVLDMRDSVKAGPFAERITAQRIADMENLGSDTNSFRVFYQA